MVRRPNPEVLEKAKELFFKENPDANTPEINELIEGGYIKRAKELVGAEKRRAKDAELKAKEQEKEYYRQLAEEFYEKMQDKQELLEQKICPRCGRRFTYLEERKNGSNTYVYCVHVRKHNGKRSIKKCYLGPKTAYIYTNTFNFNILTVRSPLADSSADIKYLIELMQYFRENGNLEKVIELINGT